MIRGIWGSETGLGGRMNMGTPRSRARGVDWERRRAYRDSCHYPQPQVSLATLTLQCLVLS